MGHGADWIRRAYKVEMSEFGIEVADLLDSLFAGIYHLESKALKRVDWTSKHYVELAMPYPRDVATYDFDLMTALVVASHDRCIRISISPHTFHSLKLFFSPRQRDDSRVLDVSRRMPSLEVHTAEIRKRLNLVTKDSPARVGSAEPSLA
jgi:hypothetical protein